MDFYQPVITKPCKRCGQSFKTKMRVEFYCDPCKPIALKTAQDRATQKRAAKRQKQPLGG